MSSHQPQPWLRAPSLDTLLKVAAIIGGFGIAWGNINARLVAIEGEAPERRATREKIAGMSESIGVLEERSENQASATNKIEAAVQRIERYLLNGRD